MSTEIEKELLNKTTNLIQMIRCQLQEVGLSKREINDFFATRIFKTQQSQSKQTQRSGEIKQQLTFWLASKQQKQVPIKELLIQLVFALEIQHGLIVEYETYQPQKTQIVFQASPKKNTEPITLTPPPKKVEPKSFWQMIKQQKKEPKLSKQSPQYSFLQNIEQLNEINESLRAKMAKLMMHQKMTEELSKSYSSRAKDIHNMLALQSS